MQQETRGHEELLAEAGAALRFGAVARARALYEAALAAGPPPEPEAVALAGLGQASFAAGEHEAAVELFERALALSPALLDRDPALADSLGRAYALLSRHREAVELLRGRVDAAERRGDAVQAVRFAILLANALADRGSLDRAGRVLGHARALARRLRDPVADARILWTEARVRMAGGELGRAEEAARDALAILARGEEPHAVAHAHQVLAHVLLFRGEAVEALALLDRGLALVGDDATDYDEGLFAVERARALALLGRRDEARAAAARAVELLLETCPMDAGRALTVLGDLDRDEGNADGAAASYWAALALLPRPDPYRGHALTRLARLLEAQGRADEALELLDASLRLRAETPG